jgi:SAM-dependent methyltransferase
MAASTAPKKFDIFSRLSARRKFFDKQAAERGKWKSSGASYHAAMENYCRQLIPAGRRVLEIGCAEGDLLAAVEPSFGVGVDISPEAVKMASRKYPGLRFVAGYAEHLPLEGPFDYIIISDVIGLLDDVQKAFEQLRGVMHSETRVIITSYNFLWEPIVKLAEKFGFKQPMGEQNWLAPSDQENMLFLADLEVVRRANKLLVPIHIPGVSWFFNRVLSPWPLIHRLSLVHVLVVRQGPQPGEAKEYSCSIMIPTRNERDNIQELVGRIPKLGPRAELVFVDGNSTDGTVEAIESVIAQGREDMEMLLIHQGAGVGKGDAVRKGFAASTGDILMILDSDLSVAPEDLTKFYRVLAEGKGEFANGSRLVYPLEDQAMRTLNILGNKAFSLLFTWLLGQPFRDTLCGTKVILRETYNTLAAERKYFGDFDPFGDFDLIFGAVRLNLKIVQVPIRYYARTYGTTKISRFQHGWLLLRMCWVAARKLKFI